MYEFSPLSPRVERVRAKYRDTVPYLDINRYRLVTEFYMVNRNVEGSLKRALNFRNLCEKMPIFVCDDELIVGSYTATFKGSALYPEYGIRWLVPELEDGSIAARDADPYQYREEDRAYILETAPFWDEEGLCSKVNPYIPEAYKPIANSCVVNFTAQDICPQPVGHFAPNYKRALERGFASVKNEADAKIAQLEAEGIPGDQAESYNFYRSVSIVCEGMITFAKRYADGCAQMAKETADVARKAELERISATMAWIADNPPRDFREAIQMLWFYQMCVLMDANMHGTSIGRLDQILGPYVQKDLDEGAITWEQAQELVDLYYLKVAECNKAWALRTVYSAPGYTSGQLITLGGIDADGNDATNPITYMGLEAMGRMRMHSPTQGLRVHPGTPQKLWECAIAVNRINGGVPSWFNDQVIMKALKKRGIADEDLWNYCLIGCVEPSIGGAEWPACGGLGISSYVNFANILQFAINAGKSYRTGPGPLVDLETKFGPSEKRLYEMESMDEILAAYEGELKYWVNWYVAINNVYETVGRRVMPQPVVSAMMCGCMESGRDVVDGGAKYNSTGVSGIGLGNVVESLNVIDKLCFKDKSVSTRELYDALIANWEGYEELREKIAGDVVHYGNNDPEADKYCRFVAESFADYVNSRVGMRGNHYAAGLYPVTMNVTFGKFTAATPDGRRKGEPLSDGISAVQGYDVNGPTAILGSVSNFDTSKYSNGLLLNMKFHPSAISDDTGVAKLASFMQTYFFNMDGMEMQLNIVSADMLRDAQMHPEGYKDLVVRIAGFSAYFTEVYKAAQDDLIRRTELSL